MLYDVSRAVTCVIVKTCYFLAQIDYFSKDMANYAIFILVPNIYKSNIEHQSGDMYETSYKHQHTS